MDVHPDAPRPLVVLVDDDPEILRSLGRLLRRESSDLLATDQPRQALDWARSRRVDLLITDQRMPDLSGTELIALLRDESPATKFVILSGFPDTALVVHRSGLLIERLISKPWDNDALLAAIRGLLTNRTDARPAPFELRIDCRGRNVGRILADVLPACRRVPGPEGGIRIVFENLLLLDDSLARLMKDLARTVAWSRVPIEIRDASGCVDAFLDAMGNRVRLR